MDAILFYEDKADGVGPQKGPLLLAQYLPGDMPGRAWRSLKMLLSVVVGNFDESQYHLLEVSPSGLMQVETPRGEDVLRKGSYVWRPKDQAPHLATDSNGTQLPLLPSSRLSSPASSSSSPRTALLSGVSTALRGVERISNFRQRLLQRDSHCLISHEDDEVEASHVLALAWWNDVPQRRQQLPQNITDLLYGFRRNVNDVRNGLLLSKTLALAFDKGRFSVYVDEENRYRVVALDPEFMGIDQQLLDVSKRIRSNGSTWGALMPPKELLRDWHLRMSVFRNMRGGGYESDDEEDDLEETIVARGASPTNLYNEKLERSQAEGIEASRTRALMQASV